MILDVITVYKCNGLGCNAHKVVSNETVRIEFHAEWFVGHARDFCPKCRTLVSNQAAIAEEELLADASLMRIQTGVARRIEEEKAHANGH